MSRYIDADDLLNFLKDLKKPQDIGFGEQSIMVSVNLKWLVEKIESLPTADVVEVIRCKDCKHGSQYTNDKVWCSLGATSYRPNDYCSYGERREIC